MLRWCSDLLQGTARGRCRSPLVPRRPATRLQAEALEDRLVLSASPLPPAPDWVATPNYSAVPASSPGPVGYAPATIRHAYGFDSIAFNGTVKGDGSGQTIAIVDAYDDPTIANDLAQFDSAFGLPNPPSFTRVAQDGSSNYPAVDSAASWELEESLDVEWAHAMAPGASIVLVEASSTSLNDLDTAVDWARNQPGVSVVSMSYGGGEFSGESYYDGYYTTPSGHAGVTFVASAGDNGAPPEYPSVSPKVLAVGGTTLSLSSGNYAGETGWSGGGGGISSYEAQPGYQQGIVTQSSTARTSPDVAFDADPNSGVAVYDSYTYGSAAPWVQVGGTSLSAPCWAGLVAVTDQGRALNNQGPLDGASGTLPALYALPASDFHDITAGNNGYAAGPGYDLVTGRGSPLANLVVADLAQVPTQPAQPPHLSVTTSASSVTAGSPFSLTVQVLDANNQPVSGYTGTVHFTSSDRQGGLPADYTFTTADAGTHTFSGVVLKTAGSQSVTATDTVTAATTGSASVTVSPASLNTLTLTGFPSSIKAGVPGSFTVTARDAFGNTLTGYRGTVHFTSSDAQATLPADYTFTSTDKGRHYFSNVILKTAGTQSLTVTDKVAGLTGTQSGIVVSPNSLSHFQVTGPASVTAGTPFSATVVAQDAYNNTVTSYAGTVHFTSSDTRASLPANYTFTTSDAGKHTFSVTLGTKGTQTVTARDTVNLGLTGTGVFSVVAPASPALAPAASTGSGGSAAPAGTGQLSPEGVRDAVFATLQFLAEERDGAGLGLTARALDAARQLEIF